MLTFVQYTLIVLLVFTYKGDVGIKFNKISLFIMFLSVVLFLSVALPPIASANVLEKSVSSQNVLEIERLLEEIEAERIQMGQVSEEKVKILEEKLISIKKRNR